MFLDRSTMKFENIQGDWFADIPEWIENGGNHAALQMILGADEMLDKLSNDEEEVTLFITTNTLTQGIHLKRDNEEAGGYWYWLTNINEPQLEDKDLPERIWLCEVTQFVFTEFPENLYVRKV